MPPSVDALIRIVRARQADNMSEQPDDITIRQVNAHRLSAAEKAQIRLGQLQKNIRIELDSLFAIFAEVLKETRNPEMVSNQRLGELQAELTAKLRQRLDTIRDLYGAEARMDGDDSKVPDAAWSSAIGQSLLLISVKLDCLEAEGALLQNGLEDPTNPRTTEQNPITLSPVGEGQPKATADPAAPEPRSFTKLFKDEVRQAGIKEFIAIGLAVGAALVTVDLAPIFFGSAIAFLLIGLKVQPKASDKLRGLLLLTVGTGAIAVPGLWWVRTVGEEAVPNAHPESNANPSVQTMQREKSAQPIPLQSRTSPADDSFKRETVQFLNRAEAYLSSHTATAPVQTPNSPPDFDELYWKWEAQVSADFMRVHGAGLISVRSELQRRGSLKKGSSEQEAFLWKHPTPDFLRNELATVRQLIEQNR